MCIRDRQPTTPQLQPPLTPQLQQPLTPQLQQPLTPKLQQPPTPQPLTPLSQPLTPQSQNQSSQPQPLQETSSLSNFLNNFNPDSSLSIPQSPKLTHFGASFDGLPTNTQSSSPSTPVTQAALTQSFASPPCSTQTTNSEPKLVATAVTSPSINKPPNITANSANNSAYYFRAMAQIQEQMTMLKQSPQTHETNNHIQMLNQQYVTIFKQYEASKNQMPPYIDPIPNKQNQPHQPQQALSPRFRSQFQQQQQQQEQTFSQSLIRGQGPLSPQPQNNMRQPTPQIQQPTRPQMQQSMRPQMQQLMRPRMQQSTRPQIQQPTGPQSQQTTGPQSQQPSKPQMKQSTRPQMQQPAGPQPQQSLRPQTQQSTRPQMQQPQLQQSMRPLNPQTQQSMMQPPPQMQQAPRTMIPQLTPHLAPNQLQQQSQIPQQTPGQHNQLHQMQQLTLVQQQQSTVAQSNTQQQQKPQNFFHPQSQLPIHPMHHLPHNSINQTPRTSLSSSNNKSEENNTSVVSQSSAQIQANKLLEEIKVSKANEQSNASLLGDSLDNINIPEFEGFEKALTDDSKSDSLFSSAFLTGADLFPSNSLFDGDSLESLVSKPDKPKKSDDNLITPIKPEDSAKSYQELSSTTTVISSGNQQASFPNIFGSNATNLTVNNQFNQQAAAPQLPKQENYLPFPFNQNQFVNPNAPPQIPQNMMMSMTNFMSQTISHMPTSSANNTMMPGKPMSLPGMSTSQKPETAKTKGKGKASKGKTGKAATKGAGKGKAGRFVSNYILLLSKHTVETDSFYKIEKFADYHNFHNTNNVLCVRKISSFIVVLIITL